MPPKPVAKSGKAPKGKPGNVLRVMIAVMVAILAGLVYMAFLPDKDVGFFLGIVSE